MDKIRKKQYNDYFDKKNSIKIKEKFDELKNHVGNRPPVEWEVRDFTKGREVWMGMADTVLLIDNKCTCITHAQEKVCNTDCDNETNNKPII